MKCAELIELETPAAPPANRMRLPMGLLGFEHLKDYLLITNPAEEPFAWLQVESTPALAFVVINPFLVLPSYQPDIPEADVELLELQQPEDAILLNIVTVHGPNRATVNLKGPVIFNRRTNIGKQVILANAVDYSVEHPVPVTEVAS